MVEHLLRFSPEVDICKKGVLIEGRLLDGSWRPILNISPNIKVSPKDTLPFEMIASKVKWQSAEKIPNGLVMKGDDGIVRLVSQVTMRSHDMLRVDVKANVRPGQGIEYIKDRLSLIDFENDSSWTPLQAPEENMVIGDLAFHSSGVVMQKGARQIAIMPNFRRIPRDRKLPIAMEIDKHINEMGFGFIPYEIYKKYYHVCNVDNISEASGILQYSYFVYYQNNCKPKEGIRRFVHRSWRLQGERKYLEKINDDVHAEKEALLFESGQKWLDEITQNGSKGAIYNDVQACSAQSAFGMALKAKRLKQPKSLAAAKQIIQKIIDAPRINKLFPAIYQDQWQMGGIAGPDDKTEMCRLTNCSWTGYWLLKWHQEIEANAAILQMVDDYGQQLIKYQRHGGHIPAWIRLSTNRTVRICAKTAEVSMHGIFLTKLYRATKKEEYLKGSRRIINFLIREVLPDENWQNTEIFYDDIAPREKKRRPQGTRVKTTHALGLWWTAESLLQLYKVTGTPRYLAFGQRIIDRLSYFQQLWDNPWMEEGSFGGFGRSNCSDKWNDSIQSLCAKTYMDYYEKSGLKEYFQRGLSALFAAYSMLRIESQNGQKRLVGSDCFLSNPMNPLVNYADNLPFEQVSGKVLVACEMIYDKYGDLYVDTKRKQAFGIDGLEVEKCQANLVGITVLIKELKGQDRKIIIKTDNGQTLEEQIKRGQKKEIEIWG